MTDQPSGFASNLWAPWRMEYIRSLSDTARDEGCFLCAYRDRPADDEANLVLWRARGCLAVLNRFPYTNGHLLISPQAHQPDLEDLTDEQMTELWRQVRDAKTLLARSLNAQGFNVGINFGLCAGAGLPGHLHVHVVPRWNGDTNYMPVLAGVRVIPEALDRLYSQLRRTAAEAALPLGPPAVK